MKKILIGECGRQFSDALARCGFSPVILPKEERLSSPVSSHADMLCVMLSEKLLFTNEYFKKNKDILSSLNTILTDEHHGCKYPEDIIFNVLFTDNALYGKLDSISEKIISFAKEKRFKMINVKQGYTKCSVAVTKNGYITSDDGLYAKLTENGEKVLKIRPGGIVLEGVDYGFIGGASFYCDGVIYFFGDVNTHPDCEKIKGFCKETLTKAVSLSDSPLTDIGGGIVL